MSLPPPPDSDPHAHGPPHGAWSPPAGTPPVPGQPGAGQPGAAPPGFGPAGYGPYSGYGPAPVPGAPWPYPAPYGGPGWVPPPPTTMPGQVTAARVLLFILGGLVTLGGSVPLILGLTGEHGIGTAVAGAVILAFAGLTLFAAIRFGSGGRGIRVLAIVVGSFFAFFSFAGLAAGGVSLPLLAGGVLVIIFTAGPQGHAWFNRPRPGTG